MFGEVALTKQYRQAAAEIKEAAIEPIPSDTAEAISMTIKYTAAIVPITRAAHLVRLARQLPLFSNIC